MNAKAILCGLALALFATAARADGPAPVMLRESAAVTGNYVRLGDFFTNAGDKAATIVAYAPEPGKRAVFDARWLYRVARGYGLAWRPMSPRDQVIVRRNSRIIGRQDIEDHILAALMEKGVSADTQVAVSNRNLRLHVPGEGDATLGVEDVAWDRRSNRFSAIVVAPAGSPSAKRVRVTGRLFKMTEVPVLARRHLANKVIKAEDLTWIMVRSDRVRRDIVVDANDLIGMAPKRTMRADKPIRAGDVDHPVMVKKGSMVTILLRAPMMTLTAKGLALQEGGDGDTIRVSNTASNNIVEAKVVSADTVEVRSRSRLAMN